MFKITRTGVFVFLFILFFFTIQIVINQYKIESEIGKNIMGKISEEQYQGYDLLVTENMPEIETIEEDGIWQIEIPVISLKAPISEGTTQEILNEYVGHFEKTSKTLGNIGLAAHNRGYQVNYFKDLKLLKQGDEIIYKCMGIEKIYEVEKCRIIRDTEWKYLEQTGDNMLTLITCVENQPEYRRCIQAYEKIEEE